MLIQTDSSYLAPRDDLMWALQELNPDRNQFIADLILPLMGVKQKNGKFDVIKRENAGLVDDLHVNGGAFNRVNMDVSSTSFLCTDKGLEQPLTTEDRDTFGSQWDVEFQAIQNVDRLMRIAAEIRMKTLIFNTTTWAGSALFTDNSGSPWDTIGTKIIDQVNAAKNKVRQGTGFVADSMVIGAVSLLNILKNTEIKAQFPNVTVITQELILGSLKSIFGLDNLYIGGSIYNSANEGQDFTSADIWPDDYAMVFKKNQGNPATGGLGRTVFWDSSIPNNYGVVQYGEPQTDSDVFRVRKFDQEKVFDSAFGHLMQIDA